MLTVHLDWRGPFNLATIEGRQDFSPPSESGVYLWCVGRDPDYRVSYVGQASNVEERMCEHIFSMLGGAYWLYSDAHLINGSTPVPDYKGGLRNILDIFLGDFDKYSAKALYNLQSYCFFWATLPSERSGRDRRAVESALITEAKKRGQPLQNDRLSLSAAESPRVRIISKFAPSIQLPGVPEKIEYGAL